MKVFASVLLAATTVGMVVAANHVAPLAFRGGERRLADNEFDYMKVYYNPSGPTCWLKYQVTGYDEVRVDFDEDEIDVGYKKMTCTTTKSSGLGGVSLPLEEDLPLDDATWVTEAVMDADVRWQKDSKKLEVAIKRFRDWDARYDPSKTRPCVLTYNYKQEDRTTIEFSKSEVSVQGNKVTCKTDDLDGKLPTDKGLREFDKHLPNDEVEWVGSEVKDARVTWEKGDPLKLVIERDRKEPIGREAFEDLRLEYNDFDREVTFTYKPECDGETYELFFGENHVTEEGTTVTFGPICEEAPDCLDLPIEFVFKVREVTWATRCDSGDDEKEVVVTNATFTWSDTCGTEYRRGTRQLGRKGRARGDVRRKGR